LLKCRLPPSKTPLLDRRGGLWRGAEGDETVAEVVDFLKLIPPPRRAKFASLICLVAPPVQEGSLTCHPECVLSTARPPPINNPSYDKASLTQHCC